MDMPGIFAVPFEELTVGELLKRIRENRKIDGRPTDNRYIVCNQDEPYAEEVWQTILKGEDAKNAGVES